MWFADGEGTLRPGLLREIAGAEAFILGAGFSRAISASMPLVQDLVEPLNDFLGNSRGTVAASFPQLEDVELFLSCLAVPQPFLDEASNFYNRGLFVEATRWLARHMFATQQTTLGPFLLGWKP